MAELFGQFIDYMRARQAETSDQAGDVQDHQASAKQGAEDFRAVVEEKSDKEEHGSAATSSSEFSWADEVEQAASESSVELAGAPRISAGIRKLRFGGGDEEVADEKDDDRKNGVAFAAVGKNVNEVNGMKRYVKTENARAIARLLKTVGVVLPKRGQFDLALVTYSAATMPSFFVGGKAKYKSLAVIGDAALTLVAVSDAAENGMQVDSAQYFRSTVLSDANMRRAFAKSSYVSYISFGTAIDPSTSKTGATALEAIAGVVYKYCGVDAVRRYAQQVGLSVAQSL